MIVYCEHGIRAGIAAEVLKEAGFSWIEHLDGDMSGWRKRGLPIEQ